MEPISDREIVGREAIRLYSEQINAAKNLIRVIEVMLGKEESITPEIWEQKMGDLDRTIMALSGLKELGMLIEEQKNVLTKLETQRKHVKRILEERKRAMEERKRAMREAV